MRRREFVGLLGSAVAAWPLTAWGQQGATVPRIGILGANSALRQSDWTAAFLERLREKGWVDGRNVAIEYRWAEGINERAVELAAELVRKSDIIVTSGTTFVLAAKRATSSVPIVFASAADPVATGLVESLARPGGNVTGLSVQSPDLVGKRIELLREAVPNLQRLAVIASVDSAAAVLEMSEVRAVTQKLGLDMAAVEIRRKEDFAPAFDTLRGRAQALYVVADPLIASNRFRLQTLALTARLATIHGIRDYVEIGGLMSYSANFADLWRRAGDYVDKILRGTKPVDISVEQPTKFDLVINSITAQALGLVIPPMLLARADEVIE